MTKTNLVVLLLLIAIGIGVFLQIRKRMGWCAAKEPKFTDAEYTSYYKAKEAATEAILGPLHTSVGHAIIPFAIGGAVDMYYFPNGIAGTGFATMELIEPDGTGPKPNRVGTYELVAFTKLTMPVPPATEDQNHPFNKIERRMCSILTIVGRYAFEAVLNPGDTSEVPGKEGEPNRCLIFDEYRTPERAFEINGKKHCLLLCIEVFRSEMEYAMKHGSGVVLEELKKKGHYPYSDLDREPVF